MISVSTFISSQLSAFVVCLIGMRSKIKCFNNFRMWNRNFAIVLFRLTMHWCSLYTVLFGMRQWISYTTQQTLIDSDTKWFHFVVRLTFLRCNSPVSNWTLCLFSISHERTSWIQLRAASPNILFPLSVCDWPTELIKTNAIGITSIGVIQLVLVRMKTCYFRSVTIWCGK